MQEKVNVFGMKFAEEPKQIDERSATAIDRPGCDHVQLMPIRCRRALKVTHTLA
jgi:hypothetical protein